MLNRKWNLSFVRPLRKSDIVESARKPFERGNGTNERPILWKKLCLEVAMIEREKWRRGEIGEVLDVVFGVSEGEYRIQR